NFGKYGGQIFVTDADDFEFPVPQTQPLKRDGKRLSRNAAGRTEVGCLGVHQPGRPWLRRNASVGDRCEWRFHRWDARTARWFRGATRRDVGESLQTSHLPDGNAGPASQPPLVSG